ncbi:hypothetical protein L1987_44762 [Smallanthus sonchifolius]|uniref:Uncharacterized protein n=1 Tax=Smallanthus sonchifolius TaxID=185202 RepID=A0ACB9GR38_9ASTR|nr:hypothetical protein L1987_44762 [Smallanthus sonchifolius]
MQNIQSIGNEQGSLKCPRCGCSNTKFCYYNNYNLSQPRFFCKGCRRYWTKGGVLRNVPVGGGNRKTKRSKHKTCDRKSTNSSSDTSSIVAADISPETIPFAPTEAAPTLLNQSLEPPMLDLSHADDHHLFSELGTFRSLMTSSSDELPPETSSLTQQGDKDQFVENQNWNLERWLQATDERSELGWSNGGVVTEDWGLFDQSYWLNNSDHRLNYFL